MRAVLLTEMGAPLSVVENHPGPTGLGDEGPIIDVVAVGVCHSDRHVADAHFRELAAGGSRPRGHRHARWPRSGHGGLVVTP